MTELSFKDFNLAKPIADALDRAGFDTPTPIQAQAIGPQLEGRDILGLAQTGTGKTAAFALPILHHILAMPGRAAPGSARALILAPTRELAVQILDEFRRFAGGARVSTCLVLGGVSRNAQIRNLSRGVDVLVATPGRLLDLVDDRKVRLDEVRFVVLDEADRMLDMGFVQPVRRIVSMLHPRRQSAMFSATMPSEVSGLAGSFLNNPVRVEVAPQSTVVTRIEQSAELMDGPAKRTRLAELLGAPDMERAIVFARTKRGADRVAQNLEKDGIKAEAIHGNKAQNARQRALNNFRHGTVRVLVATDIAARGIDVPGISHVVNYDLPDEPENYVHRIGRTARNGADGVAVTLCAPDEVKKLRAIEKITGERLLPGSVVGVEPKKPARGGRRGGGGGAGAKPAAQGDKARRPNRRRRGPARDAA